MPDELTPEEQRLFGADAAACDFAKKCRVVEEHTPVAGETSLTDLMNTLMTELWDNGFSQAEIRRAFQAAVDDLNRYAAGSERNGTGIRGTALPR